MLRSIPLLSQIFALILTGPFALATSSVVLAQPNDNILKQGIAAYQAGDYEAAVTAWRQMLDLDPQNADAYNNLGATLYQLNNLEGAIEAYRQAIAIAPDASTHNNLGVVLAEQGNIESAIAAYNQALELNPDFAAAHNNLGNTLTGEAALQSYQRAIELNPDYGEAYENLGLTLVELGLLTEGIAAYERALVIQPDNPKIESALKSAREKLELQQSGED